MATLTDAIPRLHRALSRFRATEDLRIHEGLMTWGVTGVHGEPQVGTTSVIETVFRDSRHPVIRVDLDGASSELAVAWLIARGIARLTVGVGDLSLLAAPSLAPASARREYIALRERVGQRVADLAIAPEPAGDVTIPEALDAIHALWHDAAEPPALWIDHLQAPLLTARHPVEVNALLWNVRDLQQRTELPIIVSGNTAATTIAYGRDGAFYGDGVWVTIDRPRGPVWAHVAANALDEAAPSPAWTAEMAQITDSHPQTMLLALALYAQMAAATPSALDIWQLMLSLDDGHVGSAMQLARSVHRLGGDVLERIAAGIGPYEGAQSKRDRDDRGRAVGRLHEAGLVTRTRPRTWAVTNPLIAARLRRELPQTVADARPFDVLDGTAPQPDAGGAP